MAPRTSARALASSSSTPVPAPARSAPPPAQPATAAAPQLLELRRQWKWAALSQFLCTFAALVALDDVSLVDIEEDLVYSRMLVLPRLMQRLLVTLTQDRKISLETWQTALRKQYLKRDPEANPIGVEPQPRRTVSRATTADSEVKVENTDGELDASAKQSTDLPDGEVAAEGESQTPVQQDDAPGDEGEAGQSTQVNGKAEEVAIEEEKPEAEPIDWADLSMLEKLDSIHTVTEWHFQNPLRLRSVMRSDDEYASWRTEPIGYDAKQNVYWLIGVDRLWIQRQPPKPPKKKNLKRKASSAAVGRKSKSSRVTPAADERSATNDRGGRGASGSPSKKAGTSKSATTRGSARLNGAAVKSSRKSSGKDQSVDVVETTPGGSGRARAAKTQANVMLDLQAKQLAVAQAEMRAFSRGRPSRELRTGSDASAAARPTLGTRMSRRLRGNSDDEEWQQIPAEWLADGSGREDDEENVTSARRTPRRGAGGAKKARVVPDFKDEEEDKMLVDSDDESELTELSDAESVDAKASKPEEQTEEEEQEDDKTAEMFDEWFSQPALPSDFVEWETICVSLQEWEIVADRFKGATHYLEKALYKVLSQEIVPVITEALAEVERQRLKEEALMNRKRSSRIAIKETEKEAAVAAAQRQAEEDEKMARTRRMEARTKKEEEERLKREEAREQRRKEREERELARLKRSELGLSTADMDVDVVEQAAPVVLEVQAAAKLGKAVNGKAANGHKASIAAPAAKSRRQSNGSRKAQKGKSSRDDWELNCEVCGVHGINLDNGGPLMSCGKCAKWQHISCHDAADDRAGRPRRNWAKVDFICRWCLASVGPPSNGNGFQPPTAASRWQYEQRTPYGASGAVSLPPFASMSRAAETRPSMNGAGGYHASHQGMNQLNGASGSYDYSRYGQGGRPETIIPATSKRAPPSQPIGQASVTFAHYQPLQRGFAPQPSAVQPRHDQAYLGHGVPQPPQTTSGGAIPPSWGSQSSSSAAAQDYRSSSDAGRSISQAQIQQPYQMKWASPSPYANGTVIPGANPQSNSTQPYVSSATPGPSSFPYPKAVYTHQQAAAGAQPYYHPQA